MKILVSGGTGFIGSAVVDALVMERHSVVLLTRNPAMIAQRRTNVEVVQWDAKNPEGLKNHIDGTDAVMNFAGESLAAGRWTSKQKEKLISSRTEPTRALVVAIANAQRKPSAFLSASAVGYYGHVESGDVTEESPAGNDFLASLVVQWETEARRATEYGVRVVTARCGVVLDRNGGALPRLTLPFTLFAGGWLGSGKQWFPWIHRDDVCRAIIFALINNKVRGALNFSAPDTVTNKEFCTALGAVLRKPCWAPVPSPVLRIVLGEMADMLLTGQKIIPSKLLDAGFVFHYPTLRAALENIFGK